MTLKFNRVIEVVEVHARTKIASSYVQRFVNYQQCARFRTTVDYDREYLWNGSINRQVENDFMNYVFFTFSEKQFGNLWSLKNDLDL